MRTCPKCGSPLEDDAKVCGICGLAQGGTAAATPAQPKRTFKFTPVDEATTPVTPVPPVVEPPKSMAAPAPVTPVAAPAPLEKSTPVEPVAPAPAPVVDSQPALASKPQASVTPLVQPVAVPAPPAASEPARSSRVMKFGPASAPEAKPAAAPEEPAPAPAKLPESVKAQPTRVMKFGGEEDKKPEPTAPAAKPEPAKPENVLERPIVTIAKRLGRDRRFLVTAGCVVLAMVLIPYGVRHLFKPKPQAETKAEFSQQQIDQMAKSVDAALPDKLEWGKEVLKKRLPTRFPDELLMEVNKARPDVKYEDKAKTRVTYRFEVAYHFAEDPKETWTWRSVTFFFKPKDGQFVLYGERWLREDEIQFE